MGPVLAQNYDSAVVDRLKALGYAARAGDLTLKLAREFGFCYGVDRAVEYAYETRQQFPDRRVFLSGEIIHNPDVNGRHARPWGSASCPRRASRGERYARGGGRGRGDPARLRRAGGRDGSTCASKGCVLVDTTCGSVLNVWKNVHKYAARRLHRRHPRQALPRGDQGHGLPGADPLRRPLPLRARPGGGGGGLRLHPRRSRRPSEIRSRFAHAASPGFDPDRDLAADRPRQPDHDAHEREPGDPGDAARGHARPLRGRGRWPGASAPSTRSAPRPRTARTPSCACWTRAASTSWS